jgi:hypothetical protein
MLKWISAEQKNPLKMQYNAVNNMCKRRYIFRFVVIMKKCSFKFPTSFLHDKFLQLGKLNSEDSQIAIITLLFCKCNKKSVGFC